MAQQTRPRWRDRWRAVVFHVLATAASTVTLGVLGALAVVAVLVLGGGDTGAVPTADALGAQTPTGAGARAPGAVQLLAVVPVMVIAGTWLGLVAGVLSAPWGRRRPPEWSRPVIAMLMGAFHLAGTLEQWRVDGGRLGGAELAWSLAIALALWTAIAIATVFGTHRDPTPQLRSAPGGGRPTAPDSVLGRVGREAVIAATLFALTVTYLAVSP